MGEEAHLRKHVSKQLLSRVSDNNRGCGNYLPRETHETCEHRVQSQRDRRGIANCYDSPRANEFMSACYCEPRRRELQEATRITRGCPNLRERGVDQTSPQRKT